MITEVWSDLHHSLVTGVQGGVSKVINVDAVKTSIDNILRTRLGERIMLPSFGSGLKDMIFERTSQEVFDDIGDQIKDAIGIWDDRVIVNSVDFYVEPDRNEVTLKMFFGIRGYDEIFKYSTALGNVS